MTKQNYLQFVTPETTGKLPVLQSSIAPTNDDDRRPFRFSFRLQTCNT